MANFILITVLIFTTYHFNFIFCQFFLQSNSYLRPRLLRKSGLKRFDEHRKTLDLANVYTDEFLKELETRMATPGREVPNQFIAAVDTHPKKRNKPEFPLKENLPQLNKEEEKTDNNDDEKEESSNVEVEESSNVEVEESSNVEVENQKQESKEIAKDGKEFLRKRHRKKNLSKKHVTESDKPTTQGNSQKICNEKCFSPECEVTCVGDQTSAACSAPGCKALTKGEDSASLCSGRSCHALCYKEECISGCEGMVCLVKCKGKKCHAVSEGEKSGSTCLQEDCMAYGNGVDSQIKCEGERCQAQCMGQNCVAACNGTGCVAGCTGKDCHATCDGKNCQELQHVGELTDIDPPRSQEKSPGKNPEDDGYFGNKHKPKKHQKPGNSTSNTEQGSGSIENVKLEYSIDIRLTPVLAAYIREKISQFKQVAGYLRYLPGR